MYTDTVDSDVISAGRTITHTPWPTVPYGGLPGIFVHYGFHLAGESDGEVLDEITGTYTITVAYDFDYITGTLGLLPFEEQLKLYHWFGSSWELVTFSLDTETDQLVATVDSFGDSALAIDVKKVYLPLATRSY